MSTTTMCGGNGKRQEILHRLIRGPVTVGSGDTKEQTKHDWIRELAEKKVRVGESTAYLRLKMDQLQTVTQSRMCCWKGLE